MLQFPYSPETRVERWTGYFVAYKILLNLGIKRKFEIHEILVESQENKVFSEVCMPEFLCLLRKYRSFSKLK